MFYIGSKLKMALTAIVFACVDPIVPVVPPPPPAPAPVPAPAPGSTCTSLQRYGLCTESIPWPGKEFHEAELPHVDPAVTVQATTSAVFCQQMARGSRTIVVPAGTVLSSVACGGHDVEVVISTGAGIKIWYPSTDYPKEGAPKYSQRVRVRGGGQLGAMMVLKTTGTGAGKNTDLIFDGLKLTPHAYGQDDVSEPIFNINDDVSRLVVINNVARTGKSSAGGGSFMLASGNDFLIANNNVDVVDDSGPNNNWAIRLSSHTTDGSSARYIIADNHFDSGGEQAIFRQGGNGTAGGTAVRIDHTFLRNNTFVSATTPLVIKDENCGTTDETYGDLNTIVFSGGSLGSVNFAAHSSSCALSKKWVITNTRWLTTNTSFVNDAVLTQFANQCSTGTVCQYIAGNTYFVDSIFSHIAPAWSVVHSPLTGLDVGSDPALLP